MCLKDPWCTLLTREAPSSIWSTFFTAKAPIYDRERSSFAYRITPWSTLHVCEGPSSVWSTFFTLEGPWGSVKDLMVLRRTLKDLYFLECKGLTHPRIVLIVSHEHTSEVRFLEFIKEQQSLVVTIYFWQENGPNPCMCENTAQKSNEAVTKLNFSKTAWMVTLLSQNMYYFVTRRLLLTYFETCLDLSHLIVGGYCFYQTYEGLRARVV